MIGFTRVALAIELALAFSLSITWLTIASRQLYAKHWRKTHIQAATYQDHTTRIVGVLQHFQTLYSDNPTSVSLADIQAQILDLQQDHGEYATLEAVIQDLTGQQLRLQLRRRQALRLQQKVVVAA